jgi:hypothetical protein
MVSSDKIVKMIFNTENTIYNSEYKLIKNKILLNFVNYVKNVSNNLLEFDVKIYMKFNFNRIIRIQLNYKIIQTNINNYSIVYLLKHCIHCK